MKQFFIISELILLVFILQNNAWAKCVNSAEYSEKASTECSQLLDVDIGSYYSLIEASLHHRAVSLELFETFQQDLKKNGYLSATNLNQFKKAIKTHLELRDSL